MSRISSKPDDADWVAPSDPVDGIKEVDYDPQRVADIARKTVEELGLRGSIGDLNQDDLGVHRETAWVRITEVVSTSEREVYKGVEQEYTPEDGLVDDSYGLLFDHESSITESFLVEVNDEKGTSVDDIVLAVKTSGFGIPRWVFKRNDAQSQQFMVRISSAVEGCSGKYSGVRVAWNEADCIWSDATAPAHIWGTGTLPDVVYHKHLQEKDCTNGIPIGTIVLVHEIQGEQPENSGGGGYGGGASETEDVDNEGVWVFEENVECFAVLTEDNGDGTYSGGEMTLEGSGVFDWVSGTSRGCDFEALRWGSELGPIREVNRLFSGQNQITRVWLEQRGEDSSWVCDFGGTLTTEVTLSGSGPDYDWAQNIRGGIESIDTGVLASEVNGQEGLEYKVVMMTVTATDGNALPDCKFSSGSSSEIHVRLTAQGTVPDDGLVSPDLTKPFPYKAEEVELDEGTMTYVPVTPPVVFAGDDATGDELDSYIYAVDGSPDLVGTVHKAKLWSFKTGGALVTYWGFDVNSESMFAQLNYYETESNTGPEYTADQLDFNKVATGRTYDGLEGSFPLLIELNGSINVPTGSVVHVIKKNGVFYFDSGKVAVDTYIENITNEVVGQTQVLGDNQWIESNLVAPDVYRVHHHVLDDVTPTTVQLIPGTWTFPNVTYSDTAVTGDLVAEIDIAGHFNPLTHDGTPVVKPPYTPVVDPYPDPPLTEAVVLLTVTPNSTPYDFAEDRGHDTDVKVYSTTDITLETLSVQTYAIAPTIIIPHMWKEDDADLNTTYNSLTELAVDLGGGEYGFSWVNLRYYVPTIFNDSFTIYGKFVGYAQIKIQTIDTIEVTLVAVITESAPDVYNIRIEMKTNGGATDYISMLSHPDYVIDVALVYDDDVSEQVPFNAGTSTIASPLNIPISDLGVGEAGIDEDFGISPQVGDEERDIFVSMLVKYLPENTGANIATDAVIDREITTGGLFTISKLARDLIEIDLDTMLTIRTVHQNGMVWSTGVGGIAGRLYFSAHGTDATFESVIADLSHGVGVAAPDFATTGIGGTDTQLFAIGLATNPNTIFELDPDTRLQINSALVTGSTDAGIGGINGRLFSCDHGAGHIYEHSPSTLAVINGPVSPGFSPLGIGGVSNRLYAVGQNGPIYEIDPDSLTIIAGPIAATGDVEGIGGYK